MSFVQFCRCDHQSYDSLQSQERDTEQRGHSVQPALGVAVAGVADLHVRLIED